MRKIAFVSYFNSFTTETSGGNARVQQFVRAVEEKYRCLRVISGPGNAAGCIRLADHLVPRTKLGRFAAKFNNQVFTKRISVKPGIGFSDKLAKIVVHQSDPKLARAFRKFLRTEKPDVVVFIYFWSMLSLGFVAKEEGIPVILDTIDAMSKRAASADEYGQDVWNAISKSQESEFVSIADVVIAIQDEEAEYFQELLPHQKIIVVEHSSGPGKSSPEVPEQEGNVLLVASNSAHNVDSLNFILHDVWPQVQTAYPKASLHVVGSVCDTFAREVCTENVYIHGRVDDLSKYYAMAQIVLNCPRFGSGLKIKAVEALQYGKCLISTPVGAQGLLHRNAPINVAAPQQVADAIIKLLKDGELRDDLSRRASSFYREYFTPNACYAPFLEIVEGLLSQRSKISNSAL